MLAFFGWLGETPWSVALHESQYAYAIIESIHVWTLALFFGSIIMFDLRLLGWTMRSVPVGDVVNRLLPWTVAGFIVMVITGSLLFYAIPLRSFQSIFFRTKMVLLLLAGLNVWLFHTRVHPQVATWGANPIPPKAARIAGGVSLVLWACIVFLGRMIAYNWFDCDRQPQSDLINFLTSCIPVESQF
jgi:hypothetical protein